MNPNLLLDPTFSSIIGDRLRALLASTALVSGPTLDAPADREGHCPTGGAVSPLSGLPRQLDVRLSADSAAGCKRDSAA